jgi:hypothetical protein
LSATLVLLPGYLLRDRDAICSPVVQRRAISPETWFSEGTGLTGKG